eukprot:2328406-Prorocentrum_lima.AAC.1
MTSSLVGSEMCIRDRPNPETKALANLVRNTLSTAHWVPWWKVTAFGPVSYTHLTLPTICSV